MHCENKEQYQRKNHICSICCFASIYPHVVRSHISSIHSGKGEVINIKNRPREDCEPHTQRPISNEIMREEERGDAGERNVKVITLNDKELGISKEGPYDIRLVPQFKIFLAGASGCGKTTFVTEMLENINEICQEPPTKIIFVYSTWQQQYDEMKNKKLLDVFIEDGEDLEDEVNKYITGQSLLIIFDDLISSKNLDFISNLYMVQGRHNKVSMVFIAQRMFVNNQEIRNISGNSSYIVLFRNPRNSHDIAELSKQMTPGKTVLKEIYAAATKEPYSYLFICLTQTCLQAVKYLSHLFEKRNIVRCYIPIESGG